MSTNATPDLDGYEEFIERHLRDLTPEQRLKGLAPEQRLAGLTPEQRLAGLSEAEQVLALPVQILRALSNDFIATLPPDIQAKVRAHRIAGS